MIYNKNYFLLYFNSTNIVNDGTGLIYNNMSLRHILGHIYDKYNAFTIKLESYICRTAATATIPDDFLLVHIDGLPFINGFDSSTKYPSSRVLEMIDYSVSSNQGYNFISSCNGVNFWKPSIEKINIKLFNSRVSDESLLVINDDFNFILSITGIEAYKIHHPIRNPFIKRIPAYKNISFSLLTYKATSLDSRNRVFQFSNVNLRNIIGSDYDKYNKFALITKSYTCCEFDGITYMQSFSGYLVGNILMSGFSWIRPSSAQYYAGGGDIPSIHKEPVCVMCQVALQSNGTVPKAFKETYIENAFEKSKETINIILSISPMYTYSVSPYNTANSQKFPHYTFQFDIIPLTD